MTRTEQLKSCQICVNKKFDMASGIICGLTDKVADFTDSCQSFTEASGSRDYYNQRQVNLRLTPVSRWKRFANYVIDFVCLMIFGLFIGAVLGLFMGAFWPSGLVIFQQDSKLVNYLFGLIASMIYYCMLEASTGRSVAKYVTRTKVVDENGEIPDLKTIIIRSACRFIPFEMFSFLGSRESGWHDKLSNTMVVDVD